ncbi:MAG: signal peptidase II [Candidatus Gastranaerophilales bacterium]|nr:signal peptidase II [Candidatus Gastranaerophilales bacterium]
MSKYYTFLIAILVCIIDQISKYLVSSRLFFAQNISLIDKYLSITKVYNTGAAFSLFENGTKLLIFFSIVVSIALIIYILKKNNKLEPPLLIAWGLILGGTIGNLADRILLGYVIDFIRLDFINFPIFNIADISINLGAFLIVLYSFIKYRKTNLVIKNEQ